jgi:hypothetical protein
MTLRPCLFLLLSWLFVAEKLRSQKQEQTTNFSTGFWNTEKQASEEINRPCLFVLLLLTF